MKKPKTLTPEQREAARERQRRYNAKPEVIEKRKAYYQKPEVQDRYRLRAGTPEHKAYQEQYRNSERGREVQRSYRRAEHGFTIELVANLKALQDNACAICRHSFADKGPHSAHADHCHESKTPRGLLCYRCNHAEGNIRKTGLSPSEFAKRLEHYLSQPPVDAASLA